MANKAYTIKRYFVCKTCGWFRDINRDEEWRREVIVHPHYGRITNIGAAMWDVKTHDCDEYMEAQLRWNMRTGKKKSASATGI